MSKQQTAVEWLVEQMKDDFISYPDEIIKQAKELEKEQSHKYAEFAIRCDRKDMKVLNFKDFINL